MRETEAMGLAGAGVARITIEYLESNREHMVATYRVPPRLHASLTASVIAPAGKGEPAVVRAYDRHRERIAVQRLPPVGGPICVG